MNGINLNIKRETYLEESGGNLIFLNAILDSYQISSNSRILDIGCGTGVMAKNIALITGANVFGTEISEKLVELANARIPCKFSSNGDIPPDIGKFNLIYCKDVLPSIQDKKSFYKMVFTHLHKDGIFCTYMPEYADHLNKPLFKFIKGSFKASRKCYGKVTQNIKFMKEAGFKNVTKYRIPLGSVALDERYASIHYDGYFSNTVKPNYFNQRINGLSRLVNDTETANEFGITINYEFERTMLIARS